MPLLITGGGLPPSATNAELTQEVVEVLCRPASTGNVLKVQSVIESLVKPVADTSIQKSQLVVESLTQAGVATRTSQLVAEILSPTIAEAFQLPASHAFDNTTIAQKYRIVVSQPQVTQDNKISWVLVGVITSARSMSFKDVINGGSADGWFRVSLNSATLAASGGVANQYQQQQLNAAIYTRQSFTIQKAGTKQNISMSTNNFNGLSNGQELTVSDGISSILVHFNGADPANPFKMQWTVITIQRGHAGDTMATNATVLTEDPTAYSQPYNYGWRVQLFLEDNIDPWYDGRINGWDPATPDSTNDEDYITIYTEGWQTALDDGIVTETINPGPQANGTNNGPITAGKYLNHLVNTYQDAQIFGAPYIATMGIDLDKLQFQGQGLAQCINDVVSQVLDNTGRTFEWFVRGAVPGVDSPKLGRGLGIVIQPNFNPNNVTSGRTAPTTSPVHSYFIYEVKDQTCYNYDVQNTDRQVVNMIALYGGRDPITQLQIYGAYQDSISISLFGLRQKRVDNSVLLSSQSMLNYATAYLLINGYPQPQTQYTKFRPTGNMKAGVWAQVLEGGLGLSIAQNLHQLRAVSVETAISEDQELMVQNVTAAAPQPFIDHAYYGALQASKGSVGIGIGRGSSVNQNTYIVSGADWINTMPAGTYQKKTYATRIVIDSALLAFGVATKPSLPGMYSVPYGPNHVVKDAQGNLLPKHGQFCYYLELKDSITGAKGDGAYEICAVTSPDQFGGTQKNPVGTASYMVFQVGGSNGQQLTNGGNVQQAPSSPNMQRLWQFVVLNGALYGAVDCRTYAGNVAGSPVGGPGFQPIITIPSTTVPKMSGYYAEPKMFDGVQEYGGRCAVDIGPVYIWFGTVDQDLTITPFTGKVDFVESISIQATLTNYYVGSNFVGKPPVPDRLNIPLVLATHVQPDWLPGVGAIKKTWPNAKSPTKGAGAQFPGPGVYAAKLHLSFPGISYPNIAPPDTGPPKPPQNNPIGSYHAVWSIVVLARLKDGSVISNFGGAGTITGYFCGMDVTDNGSRLQVPGINGIYKMPSCTILGTDDNGGLVTT